MQAAISNLVELYYEYAADDGVSNPPALASEAATLQWGGIFDANWNGTIDPSILAPAWNPPHCGHRNGVTIDLSLSQFTGASASKEIGWLQSAASDAHLKFTNPSESPSNKSANHWHAVLGAFQ
jgi:hypothetical protein